MGIFSKLFGKRSAPEKSGDMRKRTGAGPAIAAHSKDAKTQAPTGQNPAAAAKKK